MKVTMWPEKKQKEYEERFKKIKEMEKEISRLEDKEYRSWLQEQEHEKNRIEILEGLPTLLAKGNVVWCRNGSVCLVATPCRQLECKHKGNKDDLPYGPSECQNFAVMSQGYDWDSAEHVYKSNPFGSVDRLALRGK